MHPSSHLGSLVLSLTKIDSACGIISADNRPVDASCARSQVGSTGAGAHTWAARIPATNSESTSSSPNMSPSTISSSSARTKLFSDSGSSSRFSGGSVGLGTSASSSSPTWIPSGPA